MFLRISAQRTIDTSPRALERFLPGAQPIRFRNILIRKTRPQLAANHIDADSFNLKPRVFILMRKNVGAGSPTALVARSIGSCYSRECICCTRSPVVPDLEGLQGCTCSPHFVFRTLRGKRSQSLTGGRDSSRSSSRAPTGAQNDSRLTGDRTFSARYLGHHEQRHSQYRHYRPRGPRQDHAGGRHAASERHLPQQSSWSPNA